MIEIGGRHFWTRIAFKVGLASFCLAFLVAFLDALYFIFIDQNTPLERYPAIANVIGLGMLVFSGSSIFLAIRSWALLFPGPLTDSSYRPLLWFFLLFAGVLITPWFVIHHAMQDGTV